MRGDIDNMMLRSFVSNLEDDFNRDEIKKVIYSFFKVSRNTLLDLIAMKQDHFNKEELEEINGKLVDVPEEKIEQQIREASDKFVENYYAYETDHGNHI